jgi:hypothetical protein
MTSGSAVIMSLLASLQEFQISKIIRNKPNFDYNESNGTTNFYNKNYYKSLYRFYILASVTVGILFWFIAELIWTYYELGLEIKNPFPSMADGFWLAGYPFIIYFAFAIKRILTRESSSHYHELVILVSVASGLTLAYIFILTFGIAGIVSNQQNAFGWIIILTYPVLDMVVFVPCFLIIASLRNIRGLASLNPWTLLIASTLLITAADIGFGYSEVVGQSVQEGRVGIWDGIYSVSYVVMAASLYWHNNILSSSKVQLLKK